VDISAYFESGQNLVHARLRKTGPSVGANAIYVTQSGVALLDSTPQTPGWQIEITPGFPDTNRGDGNVFFDQIFDLDYRSGEVVLSQFADGQGRFYVDDTLSIDVTRPDNTLRTLSRQYTNSPIQLTQLLQVGKNTVRIRLRVAPQNSVEQI
jgi:hypothetical protein